MAQGMKRLGTPIAALLGVALIGLIATSWLINRDALRGAVEAQIRDVTGLELNVAGAIDISLLPASYISRAAGSHFYNLYSAYPPTMLKPLALVGHSVSFLTARPSSGLS